MNYRLEQLAEPAIAQAPGIRAQGLQWAVMQGSRVHGCFASENAAKALVMRLNQIKREMKA